MIIKAANGKEIDLTQFDGRPYGVFTDYVRRNIDSKWGMGNETDSGTAKYCITFKATKIVPCYTTLEIEADTENEAREKGLREAYRQQNTLLWEDGVDEDINDIEIDEVETVTEDEN